MCSYSLEITTECKQWYSWGGWTLVFFRPEVTAGLFHQICAGFIPCERQILLFSSQILASICCSYSKTESHSTSCISLKIHHGWCEKGNNEVNSLEKLGSLSHTTTVFAGLVFLLFCYFSWWGRSKAWFLIESCTNSILFCFIKMFLRCPQLQTH